MDYRNQLSGVILVLRQKFLYILILCHIVSKKAGYFYGPTVLGSVLCARISSVFCFHP